MFLKEVTRANLTWVLVTHYDPYGKGETMGEKGKTWKAYKTAANFLLGSKVEEQSCGEYGNWCDESYQKYMMETQSNICILVVRLDHSLDCIWAARKRDPSIEAIHCDALQRVTSVA